MRFHRTPLAEVLLVEPEPQVDERGLFARLFDADRFRAEGLPVDFVQTSTSYNKHCGTLRGMHFQADPHSEAKLVRCTTGAVYDVVADIRPNSPQFGRWHAVELSAENRLTLYVPPGHAHGFQTLTDDAEVHYQMTVAYLAQASRGFAWNDPDVGIAWPMAPTVISAKDRALPRLRVAALNEAL